MILAATTLAYAAPATIKLIVNGQEIQPDVPPQMINGRVMVPARFIAEPLGATVRWDAVSNTVIITGNQSPVHNPAATEDISKWISVRQLHDQDLVSVTLDSYNNMLHLKRGDVEISFTSSISGIGEGQMASVPASGAGITSIKVLRYQDRSHLSVDQLRSIGLLE
ncbi:MAG: copper amine oxidase N-terminal domain-containing protein [Candidatus Desulforudaceae bacterium]